MPNDHLYPGYSTLQQRGHWDQATRQVILDRVNNIPKFKHFNPHQQATLEALCERVMPQSFRPADRRVPIAPWIDLNCERTRNSARTPGYPRELEGFRFDDMPATPVAWEWGLEGLDQTAQALFQQPFHALHADQQDQVLETIRSGSPPGEAWQRMPARRWWIYVALRQITGIYYAHPYAWDEIGFGGPAYPRGYFALNFGQPEPWEAEEHGDDTGGEA